MNFNNSKKAPILPPKYTRDIQFLDNYKNYLLGKITMLDLAKEQGLSRNRVRIILETIHRKFLHFLQDTENLYIYKLMCSSPYQTKKYLKEDPKQLAEFLTVFDIFASNRKAEADES